MSPTICGYWGSQPWNNTAVAHRALSSILLYGECGRSEVPPYSRSGMGSNRRRITSRTVQTYKKTLLSQAIIIINSVNIIYDCRYESSRYPCCILSPVSLAAAGRYLHNRKEFIAPEPFTSLRISFDRPSCCDRNVADDFFFSYHSSGFVTSGTSE